MTVQRPEVGRSTRRMSPVPPGALPPTQPPSPHPEAGAGTGGGTPTCGVRGRGSCVTNPVDLIRCGAVTEPFGPAGRGRGDAVRTPCGAGRSTGALAGRVRVASAGRSRAPHEPVCPLGSYGQAVTGRRPCGRDGRRGAMRGRAPRCGVRARRLTPARPGSAPWKRPFACDVWASARASAPAWDSASNAENARTRPNTVSRRRMACPNARRRRDAHNPGRSRSAGSSRRPPGASAPRCSPEGCGAGESPQAVVRGALSGGPGQRTLSAISRPPPTFGSTRLFP